MKAIVFERYGAPDEVLKLTEIEKPDVGDDEVLVRVRATSVNPADWHMVRGDPYIARLAIGLRGPRVKIIGCDLAGTVEVVGSAVRVFQVGDEVFGSVFESSWGAFAEYAAVSADRLSLKPPNLSFEQAAAVPLAAQTALQAVRTHGQVEAGNKVLIIGASGGVGTFAVQIAKAFDAEVTAVCSTGNVGLVTSLGADHVIDYTEQDFAQQTERYDLAIHLGGYRSVSDYRRVLKPNGKLLLLGGDSSGHVFGPVGRVLKAVLLSPFVSQNLSNFTVKPNNADLTTLQQLIEAGTVTPVIDRSYPLGEISKAIQYLEEGHTPGKVVITV
jgi:NADPH:quinone reductase-like Zn-dependent oxidoreductase